MCSAYILAGREFYQFSDGFYLEKLIKFMVQKYVEAEPFLMVDWKEGR